MIRRSVIGSALAGALCALSCESPSPSAPPEVSSPSIEAPSGAPEVASLATATPPEQEVEAEAAEIVLPEVVIYGRVPRPPAPVFADRESPDPERLTRLYADEPGQYELYGLRLTPPEPVTPLNERTVKSPVESAHSPVELPGLMLASTRHEPRPPSLRFDGDHRLPREVVGNVMRRHAGALDVCYATAARLDPSLRGNADVGFIIGKDGRVEQVEVRTEGLDASPVVSCIRNVVSKFAFSPPAETLHVRRRVEVRPALTSSGV